MHRWGLSETSACDCGSKVQTYTHIMQKCLIEKHHVTSLKIDKPPLAKTIYKTAIFDLSYLFFLCFSLFIRIYVLYISHWALHNKQFHNFNAKKVPKHRSRFNPYSGHVVTASLDKGFTIILIISTRWLRTSSKFKSATIAIS